MKLPGFGAEAALYKTGGHYRADRRAATFPAQRAGVIQLAVGVSGGAPLTGPGRAATAPVIGPVVAVPMNISGVYRDANGKCQLGTGGAFHNIVAGMETASCQVKCGSMMGKACAAEDGQGGCTVVCNCDFFKSCDQYGGGGFGGSGGDIPITEGIGL